MIKSDSWTKLVALVIFSASNLFASEEIYKLESLELVNMGGYHRLIVECDGPVLFLSQLEENPPHLKVFLRECKLDLDKKEYLFKHAPVRMIKAIQWKEKPPMVQLDISLTELLDYDIKRISKDMLYIDFTRRETTKDEQGSNGNDVSNSGNGSHDLGLNHARANSYFESKSLNERLSNDLPRSLQSADKISLDVKEAELSNVLRLLAKQSKLNIVASRDVTGAVTVALQNVTIKEALDMIVKANGLDYIVEGDIVLVKPKDKFLVNELETRVYRLKYIEAHNLKATVSQVLSETAKVHVFNQGFQPEETGDAVGNQSQGARQRKRSSTLIVTDTPANIKQLNTMIATLDVPTPQIMIEAKLIEISPQNNENLGIDWSKSITSRIFTEVLLPSGSPVRYSGELDFNNGNVNFGTLKFDEYNAVLNFLNTSTNSKLVSNPRILTMDNQEAVISVGSTIPIPQINRGVGGQGDQVTFDFLEVNITLRVTPHIGDDDTITLLVKPEIEEIIGEVVAGQSSAPITSRRMVETVVNLKNNETVVIGGLIRENTIETIKKVWLLGDIPLIGNLFRNKNKSKIQTDLLIFITPRLLQ